ncbi:PREDICTED: CDK-activating kinase assembly factor MAT1-like [Priapulus caudatus]|uniref:CDK-activating kinase assembly factor MAT1-like n=1 Tax=Priapulus caudatus TaxID=37621 RepID=A0ABM1ENI4_PRICU|nr:PREDICTED: CDK-activating kinase assembly factor MAT1-like [Priapulus caudatus]
MDDYECPRCKTTKYRHPSLKLMVNVCGHSLCENCVELLFARGSGSCPECETPLRRSNFRIQQFEDTLVEKEVDIRKRILRDYNKKESDFDTLNEYNDYLEEIETIVFNLMYNTDVEETKLQIEQYKKDNQAVIKKNKSKLSQDENYIDAMLEEEEQQRLDRRRQALEEEKKEKVAKRKHKEDLIDELMFSDLPADHIMATHTAKVPQAAMDGHRAGAATFSSGIRVGVVTSGFLPIPKKDEGEVYHHTELLLTTLGPPAPNEEDIVTAGYMNHVRSEEDKERAGGYTFKLACVRALQDAMQGLFFTPEPHTSLEQEESYNDVA